MPHTSRQLLQQVRRAIVAALVLAGFASLVQLALPLYALHVLASAIPAAGLETLALLTLIAAGAIAALVVLTAARDRILVRAGLWLEHTLGQRLVEAGAHTGADPADLKRSADALTVLGSALVQRAIAPLLEAAWLPMLLVATALLHPVLGTLAAAFAAILALTALMPAARLGALGRRAAGAAEATATWWLAATLTGLPAAAAQEWERLDRAHVAAAYALARRQGRIRDAMHLLALASQVALVAIGALLVMAHELTPPVLVACLVLNWAVLRPLERLAACLPALHCAHAAYRHLRALPADAAPAIGPDAAPCAVRRAPPRLNVRGPLAAGFAAVLLLVAAAIGSASARLGDLAGLARGPLFETRLTAVQVRKLNPRARLHVTEGASVEAGDVIVSFDTSALDRRIAALKAQAETARRQLALVGQEAGSLAGSTEAADRRRLESLELRIGELEREGQFLLGRIAQAELELTRSEVRAPVSGRVVALSDADGETPAAGTIRLEIATADRPLLERLLEPIYAPLPARLAAYRRKAP